MIIPDSGSNEPEQAYCYNAIAQGLVTAAIETVPSKPTQIIARW